MKWLAMIVFYKLIMRPFLRIVVGVKWFNQENLSIKAPFILVANHNSHLDTMALMAALPIRTLIKAHPVAAQDYFGGNQLKRFLSRWIINAILINRERKEGDPSPTDRLITFLDKGHSLILFPEGSRGEPEQMQDFQKGIGAILKRRPTVPYIPVFMSGMGRVLPKGERIIVPFDSYVWIGQECRVKHEEVPEIVEEVKRAILAQKEKLTKGFN